MFVVLQLSASSRRQYEHNGYRKLGKSADNKQVLPLAEGQANPGMIPHISCWGSTLLREIPELKGAREHTTIDTPWLPMRISVMMGPAPI